MHCASPVQPEAVEGDIGRDAMGSDPQPTFVVFFHDRTDGYGLGGLATPEELQDSVY